MSDLLQLDRRALLKALLCLSSVAATPRGIAGMLTGEPYGSLPARKSGEMDIHHIDTGRGNSTLVIAPDGTSILIDAGSGNVSPETSSTPKPDGSRRAGEWIARYALRHAANASLDYAVATHIHPDHVGEINPSSPLSVSGKYRLTGISDVDYLMPITTVIDRAYPDYGATPPPAGSCTENYLAYLSDRCIAGHTVECARVGSDTQIHAEDSSFKVRILAANGAVWTGQGEESESHMPDLRQPPASEPPNENLFCTALRFTFGRFSYFAGGDLLADTHDGRAPWMDVETPVVRVAGRTEVVSADHHGYFDACGPEFVQHLDAQAYVVQAWDIGHPGSAQIQRMLGAWSKGASHDVFATDSLPANQLMNRRFTPLLKSRHGHVVVRVAAGGDSYRIFILDSSNEKDTITATFGPYICRS